MRIGKSFLPRLTVLLTLLLLAFLWLPCRGATGEGETPPSAGAVLAGLPESPSPESRYLIYLHGAILESEGASAVHPQYGRYEYGAILDSLAARGLVVMSELRPDGTDGLDYAKKVADQVNTLLRAGVPPEHITVAGFSKGGGIAMSVCERVANDGVNFVFMAGCPRAMRAWPAAAYRGRVLSIYEASDTFAGSCREAVLGGSEAAPPEGVIFEELEIDTGAEHGAFYRPRSEWLDPVADWALSADPR